MINFVCANIRYSNLYCRHLEHSTIIYEDPHHTPLLRLAWNKQDPNYLATVAMDACEVRMDCRFLSDMNYIFIYNFITL